MLSARQQDRREVPLMTITGSKDARELTAQQLVALLEQFASAQTVTDVNVAAGIALNELTGVDD
jgi:hypothetical protein